eukprot:g8930.t1
MEELAAPPSINMQSPRVRAAMKVMGIIPADLEQKELEEFEGNKNKHLLFEKKRRILVTQVSALASRGPQDGSTLLGGAGGDRNANFLEEVLRKERETMEVMARMAKKDIQSTVIKDGRPAHDDSIESKQVKGIEVRKQKAAFEQMLEMHDAIEEKHARKRELLEDLLSQRVSNKEALLQKEMQCRQRVAYYLASQQEEIETKYEEARQRHKKARETREEKSLAKTQKFKTDNEKKRKAFVVRYDSLIRQREQEHEEFRRNWESRTNAASFRLEVFERPELLRAREEQEHFAALAAENRERLRRANAYAVDQQIEKLLSIRQRAQVLEDKKTEADKTRMVVMRNTAVDRFKDVGVEKMLDLLEDVEIEPAAKTRINEILGDLGLPPLGGYSQEEEK